MTLDGDVELEKIIKNARSNLKKNVVILCACQKVLEWSMRLNTRALSMYGLMDFYDCFELIVKLDMNFKAVLVMKMSDGDRTKNLFDYFFGVFCLFKW